MHNVCIVTPNSKTRKRRRLFNSAYSVFAGEFVVQLRAEQQAIPGVRHQLLRVDGVDVGLRLVRRAHCVRYMEVRRRRL